MVILICPDCFSSKVEKYENKEGQDKFNCRSCESKFILEHSSYREETDSYD